MVGYQVKGSTINSKFAFVRAEFGALAEERLEQELERRVGETRPFLDSTSYAFSTYVAVLRLIAEKHYRGDLSKLTAVGVASARRTFAKTYRAFLTGEDFLRFLQRMPKLHTQFYSQGRIAVDTQQGRGECIVRHRGKAEYDEADLYVAQGFYEGAAELHGLEVVYCRFKLSEAGAEFRLRWT